MLEIMVGEKARKPTLRSGKSFKIDSQNGNIIDKKIKKKFWSREYEKGWDLSFV